VVRRHQSQGPAIEQLGIPLLGGHHQDLLQGQPPADGEMPDRIGLGCPLRKHIQKQVIEEVGPGLEAMQP